MAPAPVYRASGREESSAWPITRTGVRYRGGRLPGADGPVADRRGHRQWNRLRRHSTRTTWAAQTGSCGTDLVDGSTRSWRRPPVRSRALPTPRFPYAPCIERDVPPRRDRMELSLAEAVPLWRTLRTRALLRSFTPGSTTLAGWSWHKDVRFESGEVIAQLGESLRI